MGGLGGRIGGSRRLRGGMLQITRSPADVKLSERLDASGEPQQSLGVEERPWAASTGRHGMEHRLGQSDGAAVGMFSEDAPHAGGAEDAPNHEHLPVQRMDGVDHRDGVSSW